jgi:hypothetical protein
MNVAPIPTQVELKAADAVAQAITERLSELKVVHAETAVASAARIAGTFLFRDFKFPAGNIAPGTAVLSDKANEAAPLLFDALLATLQVLGVSTDAKKRQNFPGSKHPRHAPRLSVIETQSQIEPQIRNLAASFALNSREAALSCAIATGCLIHTFASVLDPNVGFAIASYGFIEGLKTMPQPLVGNDG